MAISSGKKYKHELGVADQLTLDCHNANQDNHPAFLFHLGDVVYDFGEDQYYYDQFYDPFRDYPLAIFAIPAGAQGLVTSMILSSEMRSMSLLMGSMPARVGSWSTTISKVCFSCVIFSFLR